MTAAPVSGNGHELPPLHECKACGRRNRAQQRRGMCHACYEKQRRAGGITSLVSARPAREHIEVLRIAGWKYREIARAARIDRSVVAFIVAGRAKINAVTALHICAIDPSKSNRRKYRQSGWTAARRREQPRKVWATRRRRALYEELRAEWDRKRAQRGGPPELLTVLGAILSPDEDWRDDALCAQIDPDLWFPEKGGPTRQAKEMCMRCPVRGQCLQYALENEERFGIWGGMSERERRRMIKESEQESA